MSAKLFGRTEEISKSAQTKVTNCHMEGNAMNNFFKRAACLAVTAVMTLSSTGALACTGYYVGKQASASGHTIIGHTVDAWNTACLLYTSRCV